MSPPRLHLFELEDFSWFPTTIRDLATDYLHFMESHFALHESVVPLFTILLADAKTSRAVDLCSGGGGPVASVCKALAAEGIEVRFILTDKYPNLNAFQRLSLENPAGIRFVIASVDAMDVPADLPGLRTMFNAFHHFSPPQARKVLECAVQARQPIGIFEIPERSLRLMLLFFFTPVFVALATPFIRPLLWRRLLWTYLIPLVPLTCWWDGMVSACRAYTVAEMLAMTEGLSDYEWQAIRIPLRDKPGHLTHLRGIPRSED